MGEAESSTGATEDAADRVRVRVPLAILTSLVFLRLCAGWHFYREGTKKLVYDEGRGELSVGFSAETFFSQAVGPLAGVFRDQVPGFHDWEELLVVARQSAPLTSEQIAERRQWLAGYEAERKAAIAENAELKKEGKSTKSVPVKFPPAAPYAAWADQIADDWMTQLESYTKIKGMSEDQLAQAADAYQMRKQQLADFLDLEEVEMTEWQHELWRLEQWKSRPGGEEIPFEKARIAEKEAETNAAALGWVNEVRGIQRGLFTDLRRIADDPENPSLRTKADGVLADKKEQRLRLMNLGVTCMIIGVGVCLMLGLFTRLASLAGAGFLLSVMATQPPWVEGANMMFFYYQLVEFAALTVLFATAAGRIAGLDYIISALWNQRSDRKGA